MYAAGPPQRGGPPGRLGIGAMARRAFEAPPVIAGRPEHGPHLRAYLSDLVRPYELTLRDDVGDGAGHSYGEMAAALVRELAPPDQPVGLVVLAFAIPDVRPGRATATYLSQLCPGSPLAFAVCDQGAAAAFTGLRLVREYAGTGGCGQALLLVVEQAGLPYDAGLPVDVPTAHVAVGLRCEETGVAWVSSVHQHTDVPPDRVAGLLAGGLAAAVTDGRETSLIVDHNLASELAGGATAGRVRVVPAGHPHTGVWWELAGALRLGAGPDPQPASRPLRQSGTRVVLATYDRQLRYLCMSTIDTPPEE